MDPDFSGVGWELDPPAWKPDDGDDSDIITNHDHDKVQFMFALHTTKGDHGMYI